MISYSTPDDLQPYLADACHYQGTAQEVFLPESTEELRTIIQQAYQQKTPVTISGRRTGLTGGASPHGGIIISTERLDTILSIDQEHLTATVQAGAILGEFQKTVQQQGMLYSPDPTERSCSIGGTIANNSSGARTFKYGPTRHYVNALTIILANGETLLLRRGQHIAHEGTLSVTTEEGTQYTIQTPDINMPTFKHAAGYFITPSMDAIDLFIGSEGTLGVIAEAELQCLPLPPHIISCIAFFTDVDTMISFVETARTRSHATKAHSTPHTDIEARALEMLDSRSIDLVRDVKSGIPENIVAAIWFEQEVDDAHEEFLLAQWYELIEEYTPLAEDTWVALTERDQQEMRDFRHAVPSRVYEHLGKLNQVKIGTDMAVPDNHFREFYHFYLQELEASNLQYMIYGHIGNCHVHANLFANNDDEAAQAKTLYARFIDKSLELGGTISAEHGVGKLKKPFLVQMYGEQTMNVFRSIKQTFDSDFLIGRDTMFDQ
jgi:D-lactate dehydrogenase (cytochrome)